MPDTPLLDRMELENSINYEPPTQPSSLPNIAFQHLDTSYTPLGGGMRSSGGVI